VNALVARKGRQQTRPSGLTRSRLIASFQKICVTPRAAGHSLAAHFNQFLNFKRRWQSRCGKAPFVDGTPAIFNWPSPPKSTQNPRALAHPRGRSTMKNEAQGSWGCLSDMPPNFCSLSPAVSYSRASHITHIRSGEFSVARLAQEAEGAGKRAIKTLFAVTSDLGTAFARITYAITGIYILVPTVSSCTRYLSARQRAREGQHRRAAYESCIIAVSERTKPVKRAQARAPKSGFF